jgi:hypothetical protein
LSAPEHVHRFNKPGRALLQTVRSCGRLLDQGGILLSHAVQVRHRGADLFDADALAASRAWPLADRT